MGAYDGHRTASGNVGRHSRPQPARRNAMQQNVAENPQEKTAPRLQPLASCTQRECESSGSEDQTLKVLKPGRKHTDKSDLIRQADAGANHIVSALVLSICWASFVQNPPRNPTHNVTPAGPASDSGGTCGPKRTSRLQGYRRRRVHHSRSSGLRSGGALFRVSGLPITSTRRGLRAGWGR